MTNYVDSMSVEEVLYEIHDTDGRTETAKKVTRDNGTADTFTVGEDTGEMFWEDGTVRKEVVSTSGTQTLLNKTINADYNTISNLEVDNLKTQEATEKDKTFIVQADGTWQLGKIQQYKRVSTFVGETGNVVTLYYLDNNYDGAHAIGLYIYDNNTSQFVPCSIAGNVLFDNITIGANGSNALYVKDNGLTVPKFNTDSVSTSIATPGVDTKLTTEKSVRELVDSFAKSMTNTINNFKITSKLYDNNGNVLSSNDTQIGYTTLISASPDNTHLATERAVSDFTKQSGKSLEVSMSTSDYKLTMHLKDWNGNILSTQIVDLPLEEMIVNVSYDNTREAFIFTLKNGTELVVPATGILKGVVTETAAQTLKNKTINAPDNTITNLDETNLKNKAAADKGKSFIVQSDGSWQLGNIQQYLRVSSFIGVAGNPSVLYYLDTSFPGYDMGMYIYDTTTSSFILTSISGNIQVDNLTISKTADGKLEVKNAGITIDKISADAVALSVRETGASNFKLPTELASRTAINLMGKSHSMAFNSTNNKLTSDLKDANGTVLSTNSVTLPFGDGLVNATYDNANPKFVFTAKDGTTKEILASNITAGIVTQTAAQSLTNKVIDVDGNTLTNVELDNFKSRAAGDVNKVVMINTDGTYIVSKISLANCFGKEVGDYGKLLQVKSDGSLDFKKITADNFENYAITETGKVFTVNGSGVVTLDRLELSSLKPQPTGTLGQVMQVKVDGGYKYDWIDAANFKTQDLSLKGKVFGVQNDGGIGLINGAADTDGVTIQQNSLGNLEVKDNGLTVPKFNTNSVSTSITSSAVDTKIPTEKAVYDYGNTKLPFAQSSESTNFSVGKDSHGYYLLE